MVHFVASRSFNVSKEWFVDVRSVVFRQRRKKGHLIVGPFTYSEASTKNSMYSKNRRGSAQVDAARKAQNIHRDPGF